MVPPLQQVRNEQGPEWLHNLKDKDLYLGTIKACSWFYLLMNPKQSQQTKKASRKKEQKIRTFNFK
jgi:hypothetical protein